MTWLRSQTQCCISFSSASLFVGGISLKPYGKVASITYSVVPDCTFNIYVEISSRSIAGCLASFSFLLVWLAPVSLYIAGLFTPTRCVQPARDYDGPRGAPCWLFSAAAGPNTCAGRLKENGVSFVSFYSGFSFFSRSLGPRCYPRTYEEFVVFEWPSRSRLSYRSRLPLPRRDTAIIS